MRRLGYIRSRSCSLYRYVFDAGPHQTRYFAWIIAPAEISTGSTFFTERNSDMPRASERSRLPSLCFKESLWILDISNASSIEGFVRTCSVRNLSAPEKDRQFSQGTAMRPSQYCLVVYDLSHISYIFEFVYCLVHSSKYSALYIQYRTPYALRLLLSPCVRLVVLVKQNLTPEFNSVLIASVIDRNTSSGRPVPLVCLARAGRLP